MIVLPIDTCEMFWRAFAGEVPPVELAQWIYAHDAELEALLPDDVYLDLISLDFADKWALHEVEKLIGDYVQRDSQAYQRFADGAPIREVRQYLRRVALQEFGIHGLQMAAFEPARAVRRRQGDGRITGVHMEAVGVIGCIVIENQKDI